MDLTPLLAIVLSGTEQRQAAEQQLHTYEEQQFAAYLLSLCHEFANQNKPEEIRLLAGVNVKNALVPRHGQADDSAKEMLAQRWLTKVPPQTKKEIKNIVLAMFDSPFAKLRPTAALVLAHIGVIEISQNGESTQQLIKETLVNNVVHAASPYLKQSSLDCLGFICEEMGDGDRLANYSSDILNAINVGITVPDTNADIKLSATTALMNSLSFIHKNMEEQRERNLIFKMVYDACQSADKRVRIAAYQCLVEMSAQYYQFLNEYMHPIFLLTTAAIKAAEQEPMTSCALLAIEFWSTICDIEQDLLGDDADLAQIAVAQQLSPPTPKCQKFISKALNPLVPLLLGRLTHQHDTDDADEWIPAMSAVTCLRMIALTVQDQIVTDGQVLAYVGSNINSPEWRQREAACIAFGAILEGPNPETLKTYVSSVLDVILALMADPHPLIKDSASWTVSQICHALPSISSDRLLLHKVMERVFVGLTDRSPKVAAHCCSAIHNLAEQATFIDNGRQSTNLSQYFQYVMQALLQCCLRPDVKQQNANLLASAHEAINVLIGSAAPDVYPMILKLTQTLIERLNASLQQNALSAQDKETQIEVNGLLCGALMTIIQKLDDSNSAQPQFEPFIVRHAEQFMGPFLKVLTSKKNSVNEDALLAIGALANRVHKAFLQYLTPLQEPILIGLNNTNEYAACKITVGLIGDICRAVEDKFPINFADEIIKIFIDHLRSTTIDRTIKPTIFSCIGDFAMALEGRFERYLLFITPLCFKASTTTFPAHSTEFEDAEFLNDLRESLCEAYVSMLQGLRISSKERLFLDALLLRSNPNEQPPGLTAFFDFIQLISEDRNHEERVIKAAVGLIGDVAAILGQYEDIRRQLLFKQAPITEIIKLALGQEAHATTKESAQYAVAKLADIQINIQ